MTCGAILLGLFFAAVSFSQTPNIGKLKQGAEAGDVAAENKLGAAYYHGQGVPQDYAEGMRWFRKAADQGYAAAQNNLGWGYEHAQGVSQDYAEAMRWYRKAADQGISIAQENLERMARLGMASLVPAGQAHAQSCPVVIQNLESSSSAKAGLYAFLTTAGSSSTYLILKYQNNSQKLVSGVRFVVVYLNSVREPVYTDDLTTPTEKLKPGKSSSLINADGQITGGQKTETIGWVAKVLFADGSTWTDDGSRSCSSR